MTGFSSSLRYTEKDEVMTQMKTVVYLDILLLVNFLTGYFLLLAAGWLSGSGPFGWRLLLGSALSALSTLIILMPPLPEVISILYKLLSGALIVFTAFGWKGPRPFFRLLGWYVILNMGLAGLILLAITRGGFVNMQVNNLSVYINLSPVVLVGSVLCMYGLVRLVLFLFGRPAPDQLWQLQIIWEGHAPVQLSAFYDTGFFLQDPLGGSQVLLVSWPGAKSQLPAVLNCFLSSYFSGNAPLPPDDFRFRLVPCHLAGSSATLPGFVAASAQLTGPNRCCEASRPTILFCPETLRDGSFAALFGSEFLQCETGRKI